jgi:long-chain fatty acid transport protein
MKLSRIVWTALVLLCMNSARAFPSNGLNLIGFGAESVGMGGADIAVARDTTAMNTNPAGIIQVPGSALDLYGAIAYPLSVVHRDRFGNDAEVSNRRIILGSGGYTRQLGDGPVTLGIGIFAQGGSGNVFKNLATPFGTRDELSSLFRIGKLTPTAAYKVNGSLSVGVSLQVVYSDVRQKAFPDTSVFDPLDPAGTFFGTEIKDMRGIGYGAKVGVQYRINDRVTLGAVYTTRMDIPLKGGKVVADMTAVGLGKVTYRDARIEGLALPQELGVGLAVRVAKPLLLAAEINWIDWSGALKTSTLRADDPDNPAAPPALAVTSTLNWRDQYVFAVGAAYDLTEKAILRAGYNYGKNPIPPGTLSPLLDPIGEHTVTFGGGYSFGKTWQVNAAVEYTLRNRVTYDNPELPFGPGAEEEQEVIAGHMMLSRRW